MAKLALKGGTPVRTKPYPSWPRSGPEEKRWLDKVLKSDRWFAGLQGDDPEALGRVKVQFPELAETVSWWAPVLAPGGGQDRGLFTLPEVGDQVVVGFEHDDTRFPIVLGSTFNQSDTPPAGAVTGGQVVRRIWKSRNGHFVEMVDDDPGSVSLVMGDAEPQLVLAKAESTLIGEEKLVITAQEIEVRADQKLVLEAPSVEITGSQGVKIDGARIELG